MATITDFVNQLERITIELPEIVEDLSLLAATDAIDVLEQRLTKDGTDSEGVKWRDYTPDYKKRKINEGRYVGFVNFRLESRMLPNLGIVSKFRSTNTVSVRIAEANRDLQDRLNYNDKLRPGILKMSKGEVRVIKRDYKIRLIRILKNRINRR